MVEILLGENVQVMAALAGVQEVVGDHRVAGDARQVDAVRPKHLQVVLDVLVDLRDSGLRGSAAARRASRPGRAVCSPSGPRTAGNRPRPPPSENARPTMLRRERVEAVVSRSMAKRFCFLSFARKSVELLLVFDQLIVVASSRRRHGRRGAGGRLVAVPVAERDRPAPATLDRANVGSAAARPRSASWRERGRHGSRGPGPEAAEAPPRNSSSSRGAVPAPAASSRPSRASSGTSVVERHQLAADRHDRSRGLLERSPASWPGDLVDVWRAGCRACRTAAAAWPPSSGRRRARPGRCPPSRRRASGSRSTCSG